MADLHGIQSLSTAKLHAARAITPVRSGGPHLPDGGAEFPEWSMGFRWIGRRRFVVLYTAWAEHYVFEIDPLVAEIAADPRYFTYLSQCAPSAKVVLGDARLRLRDAPDGSYSLIVLDAFSGDSIPMHLVTREAFALYLRKLAPGGIIAFHISNLYFDLAPTVGDLALDAHLTAFIANDTNVTPAQHDAGKLPSIWVVMARNPNDLATLTADPGQQFRWEPLPGRLNARLWTDDYSNLLGVVKSFSGEE